MSDSANPDQLGFRLMREILREDWRYQNTLLERVVVINYRLRHWGMTRQPRALWGLLSAILRPLDLFLRPVYGGQFSAGATVGRRLRLVHAWGVMIAPTAVIGNDCTIFHDVTLGINEVRGAQRAPKVADGVYIASGAKLIGGVRIGEEAMIAANSLVINNVPPGCAVMGVPAKVVFKRPLRRDAAAQETDTAGETAEPA